MHKRARLVIVSSAAIIAGLASSAFAQTPAGEAATASGADDIVVTALRRDQNIQKVPVSITAVSGEALQQQRIVAVGDIATVVPNLQVFTPHGGGIPIFALRGISMNDTSPASQAPIATYFDEVFKGAPTLMPGAMFDLERVEVLRGPQGTLYGKNTTGGAINFISRKPGYEPGGEFSIGYGNFNRIEASGAVQSGLGDKVAARLAFTFLRADGFSKNLLPGEPNGDLLRSYAVRGSVLFEPTDKLSIIVRASTFLENPYNVGIFITPTPEGVGSPGYGLCAFIPGCVSPAPYFRTGLGRREGEWNQQLRRRHRTSDASVTMNWDVADTLKITSITSYDFGTLQTPQDCDGSPVKVCEFDDWHSKAKQVTQDLRLASESDGPFNFILGAYFNREKMSGAWSGGFYNDIDFNGDGLENADDCIAGFGFFACRFTNDWTQLKKSYAAYTDVTFDLTDQLVLRGGLRFTRDIADYGYHTDLRGADDSLVGANISGANQGTSDHFFRQGFRTSNLSGKIGIDYNIDSDHMLYASFNRGYRGGAFNNQATSAGELTIAKPEIVNAYEAGFKTQWLNRTLTFNAALFHYEYKNQQALSLSNTGLNQLINIPKSRINGAELDISIRPVDTLRLGLGLGYTDSKVKEGIVSGVSIVGNRLSNSAKLSANANVEWTVIRTDAGRVDLHASVNYTSKRYFDLFNTDFIAQKGYALVDGQIRFRTANDRYGVTFWGKNLTNKYYFNASYDLTGGFGGFGGSVGAPRTYGASFDARF